MPDAAATIDRDRLATWASGRLGVDVAVGHLETPPQAGFDSDIHLLRLAGDALPAHWRDDLVLRVKSSAGLLDDARTEAVVHEWLADRGLPVPRILAVVEPGEVLDRPIQVIVRAPGVTMLDAVTRRPWQVGRLLDRFTSLHVRLHALDPAGLPTDADVLDRRLRLPRRVAAAIGDVGLADGIAIVESWADRLHDAPASVCHGDFHPLNLLVDGDDVAIIDWTDAGAGDHHCDVARTAALFDLAPIAASNAVERRVLAVAGPWLGRRYLRAYAARGTLDPDRLALWTPLHLLHDWSQALNPSDRARSMPQDLADVLRRRFEAAVARVH